MSTTGSAAPRPAEQQVVRTVDSLDGRSILLAHKYFWPQHYPYARMLREIAEHFAGLGMRVEVFTTHDPESDQADQREAWAAEHGIEVQSLPQPPEAEASLARRAVAALHYFAATINRIRTSQAEVLWVGSTPPVVMPVAARLARRLRRFRYIYHCQDVHPESLRLNGNLDNRLAYRLLRWLDDGNVRGASALITLSEDMVATFRERDLPVDRARIVNNFVFDTDASGTAVTTRANDRPLLLFAGTLGRFQNLPYLIDVLGQAGKETRFDVCILGGGAVKASLEAQVDEAGYDHIQFVDQQPLGRAVATMDEASAGLVSLARGVGRVAYPSKTMMYWSRGLPVVALIDEDSSLAEALAASRLGIGLPLDDVERAAKMLVAYLEQLPPELDDRDRIRRFAAEEFAGPVVLDRYADVIREVLSR